MKVRASRPVAAGEEIFVTYDECIGCPHDDSQFDTLQILRNFGFVEQYPQRWVFPDDDIWFEIDEQVVIDNGQQQQQQQLQAHFGDPPHEWKPTKASIQFLEKHLKHLENLNRLMTVPKPDQIPQHEWDVIQQFHHSSVAAFSTVLDAIHASHGSATEL
jgi:hypothetical protein